MAELPRPPGGLRRLGRPGRPLPTHRQWSQYLRWVAAQVPAEPILAEVDGIDLAGGRWRLAARTPTGGRLDLDCDGPVEVCVIGNGETAGSITAALLAVLPERSTIELVSDHGVLYSRGESFAENRLYSDPVAAAWQRLAERHRREFLKRTDRGVFSLQVEQVLDQAGAVHTVAGRVTHLQPVGAKVIVEVDYEQEHERIAFDWVVVAVGFDPMWFWHLLGERARAALASAAGGGPTARPPSRTTLERAVGHDLAVTGLHPKLHLPFLAGVAQGPGFPNLPCLGLLADRVLGAYVRPACGAGAPTAGTAAGRPG